MPTSTKTPAPESVFKEPTTPVTAPSNGSTPEVTNLLSELPESHRCRAAGIRVENARHSMTVEVQFVTPEMAERWLTDNVHNRKLVQVRSDNAATDMLSGLWRQTGDTIKFDFYGHLLDGQNRLTTILKAQQTVQLVIVRGLDPLSQEVMDSGARRTAGDALDLSSDPDMPTNGKVTAAMIRRIIEWQRGNRERNQRVGKNVVTTAQVVAFRDANAERVNRIGHRATQLTGIPMSPAIRATLIWVLEDVQKAGEEKTGTPAAKTVEEFFDRLNDGANLPEHHPVLALRNRLQDMRTETKGKGRFPETTYLDMTIRAWNAYRDGRELRRMQTSTRHSDVTVVTTPR